MHVPHRTQHTNDPCHPVAAAVAADLYIIAPHQAAYVAGKEKVQGALSANARLSFPATNRKNSLVPLYVPDSPWLCWETRGGEHSNKRVVKVARCVYAVTRPVVFAL